ncbi:hypothetical protein C1H46_028519 [Malus baccata]|uniref:Uncharacterized protein n=1 Tax=Malus baccata TaxID=106549 RepID=A0A540LHW2_MALBA|nr:hypothetical protein C1H46_028519 [Malus baccata]
MTNRNDKSLCKRGYAVDNLISSLLWAGYVWRIRPDHPYEPKKFNLLHASLSSNSFLSPVASLSSNSIPANPSEPKPWLPVQSLRALPSSPAPSPPRSTFFSGAVTSALNILLWLRHLRTPPSSSTLRPPLRGGTNRDPVTTMKTEEDGVVGRQVPTQNPRPGNCPPRHRPKPQETCATLPLPRRFQFLISTIS